MISISPSRIDLGWISSNIEAGHGIAVICEQDLLKAEADWGVILIWSES